MRGEPMPEGLSLPEQMAYPAIRDIYGAYHEKRISRDQGEREKALVIRELRKMLETWNFWSKLIAAQAKQNRDAEAALTACRKNPTPENALHLCNVLDGLER